MTTATTTRDRLSAVLPIVREHAQRHDADATFPVEALAALRAEGLLGMCVPTGDGGPGGGLRDVLITGERLGREDLSVALIFVMHCQQVAAIARYARPALRATLLPRIVRGEVYIASVTTEPGTGAHLLTASSALTTDGAGPLRLDRAAPVVTGAAHADGFLITMRAPEPAAPTEVSLVYADRSQLEIAPRGGWQPLGMRSSESPAVHLRGTVSDDQVIGGHGRFRTIATEVFAPMAHLGWAAAWLGAGCGALARTVAHLRSPQGRGRTDLSSELLLARLARVRARLDRTNALLWHAVDVLDGAVDRSAPPVQLLLNTVKTSAAEDTFAAVDDLVELAGLRHGYLRDSPLWLERTFRDLRAASLNYGNDRLWLANGRLALLDPEVRLA